LEEELSQSPVESIASDLFAGQGEMAALMRAFDWSSTPLGPPEHWPVTLQTIARMLLANSFPMILWWGPDFIQLYNDAYIPVLGNKHPQVALGKPFRECWSEVYGILGPLADIPFNGGPATWMEDIPLELKRHSYVEEAHFTISYSPVPDPSARTGIGGVIGVIQETSEKIVGDRRIMALRELGAAAEPTHAEHACSAATNVLGSYEKDVPFALIYLISEDGATAYLAGRSGVPEDSDLSPATVDLRTQDKKWPLRRCIQTEEIVVVEGLARWFERVPPGPWADPPRTAAIVPIKSTRSHELAGFLIAGISSRLKLDESYRVFLELIAARIASAIANARAYEVERKRNEALAEIDRTKTEFFSNVSHEFRTPLTLIQGPLEDLLYENGKLPAKDHERIELAHRNSLRLLKLVNTLLDFSRIEAGRTHASFEPVDLSRLTIDLASVFRSIIERAGLRLNVVCPPFEEPVYIDREMWEKIVFNLLSNAFKFTFEGEIGVSLQLVGDFVEMTVSDTGTGIPPEEQSQLFKRFHRVRGARGRSFEGSGIGLALVQELTGLHGGTVRIESEVGHGSRFIVSIRRGSTHLSREQIGVESSASSSSLTAEAYVREVERWLANDPDPDAIASNPVASGNEPDSDSDKALILIADDNADMREYMTHMLAPHYRVEAVSDGVRALVAADQHHPDLILADVMMPVLDGFGLLHAVRGHRELSSTPVILLSARAGEDSRIEGLQAGADDYMVKPFSARELLARIESQFMLASMRQKTDAEIREREDRFRAFVAASSDVVYEMSPDWKIMCHLEGRHFIPSTESPDQGWIERYIHPDDQAAVLAAIENAINTKSIFELEHHVMRTDGTLGWTFSRAIPLIDAGGEITGWLGTATDITARKQAEAALLRSERLASLGRMASTIAHEINNPLEAMTNLLYLARSVADLPEQAREFMNEADSELQRVAHITRQSLGFYRESNSPVKTDVTALVDSAVDLLKNKIGLKRVQIAKQWDGPTMVTAVPGELRQVFSNLIANSVDAVETMGKIKLRVSACTFGDGRRGVRVTFSDNGKGIEFAARTRIFEPLYTTKGEIGTGLGLWVSQQIVEKHQGSIQMRSSTEGKHKGTSFSVLLSE
jgi:signal transduction histidine kinase